MSLSQSRSPSPDTLQATPMGFPEAITAVIGGQRITKLEWKDSDSYAELRGEWLMIHLDGKWHRWTLNDGDLIGRDWIVLSKP